MALLWRVNNARVVIRDTLTTGKSELLRLAIPTFPLVALCGSTYRLRFPLGTTGFIDDLDGDAAAVAFLPVFRTAVSFLHHKHTRKNYFDITVNDNMLVRVISTVVFPSGRVGLFTRVKNTVCGVRQVGCLTTQSCTTLRACISQLHVTLY